MNTAVAIEALRRIIGQHHAEIQIAVRTVLAAGGGTDALWLMELHQPLHQFLNRLVSADAGFYYPLSSIRV
jgi:hypothetical protein